MATTLFDRLREERDAIASVYEREFAGHNRSTRDSALMADTLRKTKDVLRRIDEIPSAAQGPQIASLREDVASMVSLYDAEAKAIAEAKQLGPHAADFSPLATNANLTFARYTRNFAGQSRNTRDVGLLNEMIEDLKALSAQMSKVNSKAPNRTFQADIDVAAANMKMYRDEAVEIEKAQKTGSQEDRASVYATLANNQFSIYTANFAGKSRSTRRPALLQRMIGALEKVKGGMENLVAEGFTADTNKANIGIVDENLKMYRGELDEIRKVKQATPVGDIMGNLGGAANEEFKLYQDNFAGNSRVAVNLTLLGEICDRLGELYKQMNDLARIDSNETNANNIVVVRDQLEMYSNEWVEVAKAQQVLK